VESVHHITHTLIQDVNSQLAVTLKALLADAGVYSTVIQEMDNYLDNYSAPLDLLLTRYKQDKYFDHHPLAVKPETIYFSSRLESHSGRSQRV